MPVTAYIWGVARTATTADIFNAIAEGRRREIIDLLSVRDMAVNEVVEALGVAQPQVSKHLRVLREVGLVSARESGRQRLYRLNGEKLREVHEWATRFERYWDHQLVRIKERAERAAAERRRRGND